MRYGSIDKRLDLLQPEGEDCPGCKALAALSDEELDRRIEILLANRDGAHLPGALAGLPPHCPGCPEAGEDGEPTDAEMEALIKEYEEGKARDLERLKPQICQSCGATIAEGGYYGSAGSPTGRTWQICYDCYQKVK